MKSRIWVGGIIAVLVSGCSTHTPVSKSLTSHQPAIEPAPVLSANESNATATPYCCTLPQELEIKTAEFGPKVNDLDRFEQIITPYTEANLLEQENFCDIQNNFENAYYTPWSYTAAPMSAQEVSWPIRVFKGGYGSNLRPLGASWFQEMEEQANFDNYGAINQKGIALRWMDLRALPTEKPLYRNPSLPGEGYPFDLLQNSSLNYNEPIFVSHASKDGAWSYIFTNNASGWVRSDNIALIDDATASTIRKSQKVFLMDDNIPLYDSENRFTAYSRIGMVLPLREELDKTYEVLAVDSNGTFKTVSIPKPSGRIGVTKLNQADLIRIGNQMLKNTYGWGGMFGERDCSSMIRDMYTPFGIWLPRNSAAQARKGEVISFEGLSDEQKIDLIKTKGIPFETIIYLKGHVVLYIGTYQETVMVMHNVWGIRTIDKAGNKGRRIVGKAVISTLELGSELEDFDPENKLLTRAKSMNIFTRPPLLTAKPAKARGRLSKN